MSHRNTTHFSSLFLRVSVFLAVFIWAEALWAQKIIFKMKNGDQITGSVIDEDEHWVTISTEWIKEMKLPVAEIEERAAVKKPKANAQGTSTNAVAKAVAPAPKPAETNQVAAVSPQTNTAPAVVEKKTPSPSVTAAAKPPSAKPPPKRWKGEIRVGADMAYGERDRKTYHGRVKATYVKDKFRNIFDYNVTYGKTDNVVSANRMDGSSKTDFDLRQEGGVFLYNLVGAGFDEVRKIDLRYEVGPGIGYRFVNRPTFVMNGEIGVNYQVQERANGTRDENFYYRIAEDFTWKVSSKLTFDQKLEYFPRVEEMNIFRLRFEANLRYWLMQNLSLNLTVLDLYESHPVRDISKNDLQIRSSIGLNF